jgi:hypothetical protein
VTRGELPKAGGVQLTRMAQGIELYFPPLRTPAAALGLFLFGLACFIPGFFAAILLAPLAESGPAGLMAVWMMSIFVAPFIVFGGVFPLLAVYVVANSLTVTVTASEIRSLRHIFGLPLRARRVANVDVTELEAITPRRFRWPRRDTPCFSLVAKAGGGKPVTVAEALRGEALLEQVRTEIVKAARLEHLAETATED